ncbi:hypothetical protein [Natrinema versiforme]|uniref:DUF8142 domain-containing protein n=1 Tax=Natrinema versiforme JCM 10478 TaxID=1227496 RepID=L9XS43_9EURY|nr:hypothetical protein [Natrinema versiforme]ELY64570.1 hypothetical protein C489_17494 [Natrinema versiforme JCM 10478]
MTGDSSGPSESGLPEPSRRADDTGDRRRAARYVAPFLALGLLNLGLLLRWGLDPLWAFAILPPMLFLSGIGWVAFRHGFDQRLAGAGSDR